MKPMPPMKISPIIVRHTTQSPEKRSQRAEGAVASHKVVARVAESRNGVENGGIKSLPEAELGTQPCRQQQSARAFKNGGADCYAADKVDYAAQSHGACGLHEGFCARTDLFFLPRTIRVVVITNHEPQPAYLDEMRITTCPKPVHLRNVSAVTNPVTQVEDVAVNSASA